MLIDGRRRGDEEFDESLLSVEPIERRECFRWHIDLDQGAHLKQLLGGTRRKDEAMSPLLYHFLTRYLIIVTLCAAKLEINPQKALLTKSDVKKPKIFIWSRS